MNIQIITSSFPAYPHDASGTAGLFVRSFAAALVKEGHTVIVQPVARKKHYIPDAGIIIEPLPWKGGDKELASLNLFSPKTWITILYFFIEGKKKAIEIHKKFNIDYTLCMWALPAGLLGYWIKTTLNKPYDVWVLGSDIWKIKKIPFFGKSILKKIIKKSDRVFADGVGLSQAVKKITGRACEFLPSSRLLPRIDNPNPRLDNNDESVLHLLFVGRYHLNKGPDLLLEAFLKLDQIYQKKLRLHMYGIGPLKNSLQQFIKTHHLEEFIDLHDGINANELVSRLNQSDYLVIPSRIESIPVIFSDALQCGVPVIATPVGDLKDLIFKYQCGIIADDCSSKALVQALEKACNEKSSFYANNTKKLYAQFNPTRTVQKWLAFSESNQQSTSWDERNFQDSLQGVLFKNFPNVINEHIHHWHRKVLFKALHTNPPQTLIDIGCGYGRLSLDLIRAFPSLKTTGLDISPHYVELYRKNTGCSAYATSLQTLPDHLDSFDCVLIVTALMYVPRKNVLTALQKIWDHLESKGKCIIIEPDCSGSFFQNPFGLKNLFFKNRMINTKGSCFKHREAFSILSQLNPKSIQSFGMPVTTWLIIPIYGISKIFPESVTRFILKGVSCLDQWFGKLPLSTLHRAYILTKE